MRGQFGDVVDSISQRGQMNRKYAEPIIQILPEAARRHFFGQVAIRCGNNPNVDLVRPLVADALETPFLNGAQELALQLKRNFTNFVEEERAAVRRLKSSCAVAHGARKRTFHVA